MSLIRQRRGDANRPGFAVQLSLLRYSGYELASDTKLPNPVLYWIAKQVRSDVAAWPEYGEREKTRNEHLHELRAYLGLSVFGLPDFRKLVHSLADLAVQTDKAMINVAHSLETLRQKRIILPALTVIERACAEAVTRANRRIYRTLIDPLERHQRALAKRNSFLRMNGQRWASHVMMVTWVGATDVDAIVGTSNHLNQTKGNSRFCHHSYVGALPGSIRITR